MNLSAKNEMEQNFDCRNFFEKSQENSAGGFNVVGYYYTESNGTWSKNQRMYQTGSTSCSLEAKIDKLQKLTFSTNFLKL